MIATRRWCVVSLLVCFAVAGRAHAGAETVSRAKALYESGTSHYNLNEFDDALHDFKEAYRVRPDPVFLFNIAQCYRQLGDPKAAASFYRSYRRELPDAPNRVEVDRLIAEMDHTEPRAVAPARRAHEEPQAAAPPPAAPTASAPSVAPAPAATSNDALVVQSAPTTARESRKPLVKRAWFWATLVAGAAVVGGAIAIGVVLGHPSDPSPSLGRIGGD